MEAYVQEQEEQHKRDLEELMQEHDEELRKVKAKVTRKSWKFVQSSVLTTAKSKSRSDGYKLACKDFMEFGARHFMESVCLSFLSAVNNLQPQLRM